LAAFSFPALARAGADRETRYEESCTGEDAIVAGPGFFAELKRRHVVRAGVLYIGAVWALAQGIAQLTPVVGAPDWAARWFLIAAVIGFPFWLGFAWIFELTSHGLVREDELPPDPARVHSTARKLDFAIIAVLSIAVVLLLANTFVWRKGAGLEGAVIPAKSVAVLPLLNESGDPSQDYFSDGLSEELISALGQVRDLKVIGRNSSFQFRGKDQDDSAGIGAKLGVATLLEGTVRKQGDHVRIVASLVKAVDGSQLWSHTYEREMRDVFAMQSDIATSVAHALQATLLGGAANAAKALKPDEPPGGNVEAYNALLQGNFYGERHAAADELKAIGYYERAVEIDPAYAFAWARLSLARTALVSNYPEGLSREEQGALVAGARVAAATALKLDANSAEARLARGAVLEDLDLEPVLAEAECQRAAELAPRNPDAVRRMAALNAELGHFDIAVDGYQRAIALDPLSAGNWNDMAISLTALKRFKDAEAAEHKAIELRPQGAFQHAWLAVTQMLAGNRQQAVATAKAEPDPLWRNWALALTTWSNGDRAQSDVLLNKLIAENADTSGSQIADVYGQRRQPDEMFRWLEHAYQTHDGGVVEIFTSPFVAQYRDDPRFPVFARKVGVMPSAAPDSTAKP
jgi:TolB-like protein/tetratricopeptide (TPR) repeat protein